MEGDFLLTTGTVFARDFRVVRPLAEGGMGAVYVVEQLSTGRQRALKVMHPQLVRDPRQRERFAQEAQAGSRIESEHVVEVLAAGIDESTRIPWLAMELLRGRTLLALVEEHGALAAPDVLEIFRQLGHALAAAHEAGLVHRDLKPENIFLALSRRSDAKSTVKLLDFGIAKWAQDARNGASNSQMIGTPLWMAPEQFEAGSRISAATDVWALGLIAFHLLTGKLYWRAANEGEASISAIVREAVLLPMDPASVRAKELGATRTPPAGFDAWFARATARDATQRYRDAAEAVSELERVLAAPAPRATPAPPSSPSGVNPVPASPPPPPPAASAARPTPPSPATRPTPAPSPATRPTPPPTPPPRIPDDRERQIEACKRALAIDPSHRPALGALIDIYSASGQWERAVDLICRYLKDNAADIDRELKYGLWHNLGVIYRDHLGDPALGAMAFGKAAAVKPEDPAAHKALARTSAQSGDAAATLAHLHRALLADPADAEALLALFAGYASRGAIDPAYCVASAIAFVQRERAAPEVRSSIERTRPRVLPPPTGVLDDAAVIKDLLHPEQDPFVSKILALLLPTLVRLKARPVSAFGLTDAELADPLSTPVSFVQALHLGARVFSVRPAPRVYLRPRQPGGVAYVPSEPWASVSGAGPLHGMRAGELLFVAGKHMAVYRPELYARVLLPSTAEVAPVVLAAVKLCDASHAVPREAVLTAEALAGTLAREPALMDSLRKVVSLLLEAGNARAVERWLFATELTACRAGLLLSGDLEATARMIELEPQVPDGPNRDDKLRAVLAFATSDAYLRLRASLGVTIRG